MKRLILFLKGICMGLADVIPGVSGGTLALILGVYRELVDSIKGLNLRFVPALLRWLKTRHAQERAELFAQLEQLNLVFLVTLGAGIATALAVGSAIIPELMEDFPVQMRAFFFGLIIASVWVPLRMIEMRSRRTAGIVAVSLLVGLVSGWFVTDPANSLETTREWFAVSSEGETLEELTRRGPSAAPSAEVFWAKENEPLRESVRRHDPESFAQLEAMHTGEGQELRDKDRIKARSEPYDELVVPAGTTVKVPRPELWFVFLAAFVAICAMILPGISGSYILLILGAYFFVLNALKGTLSALAHVTIPLPQGIYVVVFCAGAGIGLLSFARLLSYLLREHAPATLGVLVGLMVGCLRGIWPFRRMVDGAITNVSPMAGDPIAAAAVAFVSGLFIVLMFTWLGRERSTEKENAA